MQAATEHPQEATAEGESWPSHVENFAALGREQTAPLQESGTVTRNQRTHFSRW